MQGSKYVPPRATTATGGRDTLRSRMTQPDHPSNAGPSNAEAMAARADAPELSVPELSVPGYRSRSFRWSCRSTRENTGAVLDPRAGRRTRYGGLSIGPRARAAPRRGRRSRRASRGPRGRARPRSRGSPAPAVPRMRPGDRPCVSGAPGIGTGRSPSAHQRASARSGSPVR